MEIQKDAELSRKDARLRRNDAVLIKIAASDHENRSPETLKEGKEHHFGIQWIPKDAPLHKKELRLQLFEFSY
ncbi:MAG: hypothetical protein ABJG78_17405 [Cyclobacteriaceae bacterium]